MAASERAFSTNYADHLGLLNNFARKGWGRLVAANVTIDYEDVLQEMSLTFAKAAKTYDPQRGIAFTSYVGRAIWNDFNRYAQKYIDERMKLGLTSVDAFSEEYGSSLDITSEDETPEEVLERKQEIVRKLRQLSPVAKFLAAQIVSPPAPLVEAFELRCASVSERGGRNMRDMSLRFIATYYQIDQQQFEKANYELKRVYELQ